MIVESFINIAYKAALPIVLFLIIGHFIPDGEYFYVYCGLGFAIGLKIFVGTWMGEYSKLKNINKYEKALAVKAYIPSFYCIAPKNYLGDTFPSVLLVSKKSFILCESEKEISHGYKKEFWQHIQRDVLIIPFSDVISIGIERVAKKDYESTQAESFARDLVLNKTIGAVLPISWKTTSFAAYILYNFQVQR